MPLTKRTAREVAEEVVQTLEYKRFREAFNLGDTEDEAIKHVVESFFEVHEIVVFLCREFLFQVTASYRPKGEDFGVIYKRAGKPTDNAIKALLESIAERLPEYWVCLVKTDNLRLLEDITKKRD